MRIRLPSRVLVRLRLRHVRALLAIKYTLSNNIYCRRNESQIRDRRRRTRHSDRRTDRLHLQFAKYSMQHATIIAHCVVAYFTGGNSVAIGRSFLKSWLTTILSNFRSSSRPTLATRRTRLNDRDDDISRNKNSVTVTVSRPYITERSREIRDWHEYIIHTVFDCGRSSVTAKASYLSCISVIKIPAFR